MVFPRQALVGRTSQKQGGLAMRGLSSDLLGSGESFRSCGHYSVLLMLKGLLYFVISSIPVEQANGHGVI